jgi:hypothetical protein
VQFNDIAAGVKLRYRTPKTARGFYDLLTNTSSRKPDWRPLLSVTRVCNSSLHPLSTVEDLYIDRQCSQLVWKGDIIASTLWLQLLLPFTPVKNLYLSEEFAPGIATTLRELVGGRTAEVLPCLQNIFVEGLESSGFVQENIGQFVAARQLSGHHIAISDWDIDYDLGWI